MSGVIFPEQYANKTREVANTLVYEENQNSQVRHKAIDADISSPVHVGLWMWNSFQIGVVLGLIVCISGCVNEDFSTGLGSGLTCLLGSVTIGTVLALLVNHGHKKSEEKAVQEHALENSRHKNAIQQIYDQAERDIEKYTKDFEEVAQRMSVKYAESTLAMEVIEWMTGGFSRTIDAADRRSHVGQIEVPFSFCVYTNKITCALGTYDFEIKRCANLENPLQQTALARAIASSIQLNITMNYPKDASGTSFVLNASYEYRQDNVTATITYSAHNGNYRPVQGW